MIGQNSLSKNFFTVSSLLKWSSAGDPNVFHDAGLCEFPPPKRLSLLPSSRSFPVLFVVVELICDLCCLGSWVIVCAAIEQILLRESFSTVGHTLGSLSHFFLKSSPTCLNLSRFLPPTQPIRPNLLRLLPQLHLHLTYPPPSQWGSSRCFSLSLHPSFLRLLRTSVSYRHRHFPPSHPIPDQRIAGSHWLPALLRSCCRSPFLARHLRPCVRASAPHHRNHDTPQPSPRIRRRPPQRKKNLPRLSNDLTLPLRCLLPLPPFRRERRRQHALSRRLSRHRSPQSPDLVSLNAHPGCLLVRRRSRVRRRFRLLSHRDERATNPPRYGAPAAADAYILRQWSRNRSGQW